MSTYLKGDVALVTGGGRGIGAAIARAWIREGGRIVVGDIDDERGSMLVDELGGHAEYLPLDVTDEEQLATALDHTVERFGRIDCMFANAGAVGAVGGIAGTSIEDWRRTIDLLLTGCFLSVKHAVRVMTPRNRGAIVCTASVASLRGGLGPHCYTAAKHGVKGLIESVAVEIAPLGLRINGLAPGGVVSSLSAALLSGDPDDLETAYRELAAASSSGLPTTSEDVADVALFLAGAGASRMNGALLTIDGGDDDVLGKSARAYFGSDG